MRAILFLFIIFLFSCNQLKKTTTTQKETPKESTPMYDASKEDGSAKSEDCWGKRAVQEEVSGKVGNMTYIADTWMISKDGEGWRYEPCSVEEKFQVEGQKVRVSGTLREVYPNERRAGAPFSLTSIELLR